MATIVITDCDHDSIDIERAVADARGIELRLAHCTTEEDVIAAAADADAIVVQYAPVSAAVLAALPRLRVVGRYGVGVDTVDVDAATRLGVAVCNVPDYGTEDVSDHAIALALTLTRGIAFLDRSIRSGRYDLAAARPLRRNAVRTFGVVGLGLIGAATARKARGAGFSVIGADPAWPVGAAGPDGVAVVGLAELLATADVVSLHVPLTAGTRHLIGAAELAAMKPDAVLVNTSRGGVVDTAAIVDALRDGTIRAAGLDVFEVEPLPVSHPLVALDNAVLTPHAAWYSEDSYVELSRRTVENVADVIGGVRPRNVLNPQTLDSLRNTGSGARA